MAEKKKNPLLEKQIRDAIRELTEEGKKVTNQAVRDTIKSGSFRDIGPIVKLVKAEIDAKEQAARLAPEMPDEVHDAAATIWQLAWDAADESAATERRAHAAEIEKMKGEIDEALSDCALVEGERDTAETRVQAFETELRDARTALHDAQLEIARLTGQLGEREQHIQKWLAERLEAAASEAIGTEEPEEPLTKAEGNQMDMFTPDMADEKKPDNSQPFAAE
ncbi:DNA-binding protein [Aquicoccus sp. G2-2]|uniref:DNA-binding protein n=1 Tax=Aquicoccus sp. G2-2 TaxID=3092120 RepID=UPI002AE07948|nr:DNA-binding protein [Aquicoccus sp. G2-2]MEA1113338.1 DNA-binding protein [Aquicoccus sp. G2-2]